MISIFLIFLFYLSFFLLAYSDLFCPLTTGVEGFGWTLLHSLGTPQSVVLLWTRDRSVAKNSTWQHTIFTTERQ